MTQHLEEKYPPTDQTIGRPPALTLKESLVVVSTYLRRNRTQADIANQHGISQATVSRTITTWMPRILTVLIIGVPTVDDLDPGDQLIVDGTLVPCWDWAGVDGLYSGKHHDTGYNLQVAVTLSERFAWISDPLLGSTHDAKALKEHGLLDHFTNLALIGDKGYVGLGMITPQKKPAGGELTDEEKAINKSINSVRAVVERKIAHLKNWRILHTAYRTPLKRSLKRSQRSSHSCSSVRVLNTLTVHRPLFRAQILHLKPAHCQQVLLCQIGRNSLSILMNDVRCSSESLFNTDSAHGRNCWSRTPQRPRTLATRCLLDRIGHRQ